MKRHLRSWGVVYVSMTLFVISWGAQFLTQLQVVSNEAQQHQQPFSWGEFWPQYLASTFENWQSEFLQISWQAFAIAGLASLWFRKSKEDSEAMKRDLADIKRRLDLDPSLTGSTDRTPPVLH